MDKDNSSKRKKTYVIPVWAVISVILLGIIGILVRIPGFDHLSGDMIDCYLPWYDSVPAGQGLKVLLNYEGDYGIPYATILLLLHYIPGQALYKIKAVSIVFEYLAAFAAGLLASHFFEEKKKYISFIAAFGLTLLYPALVMNGAWWGQFDASYAAFVLLMIYALFKDKHALAFIYLGIALTLKLQTIFIIPFLIYYYYRRRNISLKYIILIPAVTIILYIPAYLAGYSFLTPITMYLEQTQEYPQMYMHYPGLWCHFWQLADYEMFHLPVICWVATGLALMLILLMSKDKDLTDRTWIGIIFWSSLFPVYFLPAIHERYGLIAEVIAVIYAILYPKRAWMGAALWATISWAIYQPMMMERFPEQERTSILMAFVLIALTTFTVYDIVRDAGSTPLKSTISKYETGFIEFLDRNGIYLIIVVIFAFVTFTGIKVLQFENPDYLQNITDNEAIPRTALRLLYEGISGRYTHLVLLMLAALLWTGLSSAVIPAKGSPAIASGAFIIGLAFLPATCAYPILEKSPDGLCLMLSGIGSILYIISGRGKKLPMLIASILFYGLSVSVSPAYLIFNSLAVILYHIYTKTIGETVRNTLIVILGSVFTAVIISLICADGGKEIPAALWALASDFGIQGAVLFPLSVLLLIMCRKDLRYILPMLFMQYAVIIDFGRYVGAVRVVNYVLIPVSLTLSISAIVLMHYLPKKEFLSDDKGIYDKIANDRDQPVHNNYKHQNRP